MNGEPDWDRLAEIADLDEGGLGPAVTAKWRGFCRACGTMWRPGEDIRFSDDEDGWLGPCCGPDAG